MRFDATLVRSVLAASSFQAGCTVDHVEQACRDVVHALGTKAEECGEDREAVEEAIEQGLRDTYGAGCEGVDEVRDIDGLYDFCLPRIEGMACEDYRAGNLPLACRHQLNFYP
ncbi:MAG: hypothetical protein H6722_11905 [Sandaracinus sp.]|nr:hypothetical protein [Sandaracinus sp.]MCB9625069.1 hypothetical protein [Sandaracinus sp.]